MKARALLGYKLQSYLLMNLVSSCNQAKFIAAARPKHDRKDGWSEIDPVLAAPHMYDALRYCEGYDL